MKLAVISDIHNNQDSLAQALEQISQQNVRQVLCLGDLTKVEIAQTLADFQLPVVLTWGNNDFDKEEVRAVSRKSNGGLIIHEGEFAQFEFDGRNILGTHYPEFANEMVLKGEYDGVFYGHTHYIQERRIGQVILANPGELKGLRSGKMSFLIYDSNKHKVNFYEIK